MNPYKKVAYHTLGCKLNFSETSTIARQLSDAGYARVPFTDQPDIFVINTCSVTDNADKKCRNVVSRAKRVNTNAHVIVIGCYAQLKPQEIVAIPGVSLVLGAEEKFNVLSYLEGLDSDSQPQTYAGSIKNVHAFAPAYSMGDRTRSFLKVQDGCDYHCAFCTIPLARGKSRSGSIAQTIAKAHEIGESGVREVVLTGVNIGDFGADTSESFFKLIQALDEIKSIDRFRISSIEPNLLTDEIIDFVLKQSQRFVPHFHIPLQSGSDVLLKAMRRKYNTALYRQRIKRILSVRPDACIGVDVIVGFPGESDQEFEHTLNFLNDLNVSYLHVFSYSERDNTTAKKMPNSVPKKIRNQRSKQLQLLSLKKRRNFYAKQIGKTVDVLWEQQNNDGYLHGFSENYVKVSLPFTSQLQNKISRVTLIDFGPDETMSGQLESPVNLATKKHAHVD